MDSNLELSYIDLQEVKELIKGSSDFSLIDVRASEERKAGVMPKSSWIPIDQLEEALKLNPSEFNSKYNFDKPASDSKIIFSCHAGMRAEKAARVALASNYTNVCVYKGSWMEFSQKCPDMVVST